MYNLCVCVCVYVMVCVYRKERGNGGIVKETKIDREREREKERSTKEIVDFFGGERVPVADWTVPSASYSASYASSSVDRFQPVEDWARLACHLGCHPVGRQQLKRPVAGQLPLLLLRDARLPAIRLDPAPLDRDRLHRAGHTARHTAHRDWDP